MKRRHYQLLVEKNQRYLDFVRSLSSSRSENFQDLWVLGQLSFKKGGYFVEFGATNGIDASNTWLLEKKFNWNGILVEPNRKYHHELVNNRNCHIDQRLVWHESNKTISFLEMAKPYLSVAKEDLQLQKRELNDSVEVNVDTVSLSELLKQHGAPQIIDFMSIDVEGSEERILRTFFADKEFVIDLFCIEHNWRDVDNSLLQLVLGQGYERVCEEFSGRDYWFRRV